MSEYTPEPWHCVVRNAADGTEYVHVWSEVDGLEDPADIAVLDTLYRHAPIGDSPNLENWNESVANGILIAAAPDLLAACEATIACLGPRFETYRQLQEAIAKAKPTGSPSPTAEP